MLCGRNRGKSACDSDDDIRKFRLKFVSLTTTFHTRDCLVDLVCICVFND
jgi:hypothetical protein